jgi:hypothetical protein
MNAARSWILGFFGMVLLLGSALAAVNWVVDPVFCFDRSREHRKTFDDRLQKSAHLVFSSASYDAMLMGSSRIKLLGDLEIEGLRFFNYGMNDIIPEEFGAYLSLARAHNAEPLQMVALGMDFFNTNTSRFMRVTWDAPDTYIAKLDDPFFRIKTVLSNSSLGYSLKFFQQRRAAAKAETIHEDWNFKHYDYYDSMYLDYEWNTALPTILSNLANTNQAVRLVVFTTPVSQPLFEMMVKRERYDDYKKWLRLLVSTFGEVHHFMDINSVTTNPRNFRDENHVHPEIAKAMIERTLDTVQTDALDDFGTLLDADNIDAYLERLDASIAEFDFEELVSASPPGSWQSPVSPNASKAPAAESNAL